ncbi:MAG: PilZ domain-containing protein [SAR324 cluster bacterium]|nr:PilZ domain-containing protein [SAR324 cluster bacterium]MBL7035972.1 PilZ domain-containing protein [SAR324 cluster bacterium]
MLVLRNIFQKLAKFVGITMGWWFLCGIDRSGKQSNFGIQDLQTTNLLQTMPSPSEIPLSFYLLAGVFVFSVVGGILLVKYLQKKKIQEGLEQIAEDQAQLSLDSEFEARHVEEEDREFLITLCNTGDPAELLPVIVSDEEFEIKVEAYKNSARFSKSDLEKIYMLRKSLQFTFKNTDVSFSCTQMLEVGTHLECHIRHKNKNVVFMTSILDSNETQLLIKPPTVKRRPANMKQFPELHCKIRRGKDADYEFNFKIIGQLIKDINAVVLKHTSEIRKLQIRTSERLPLETKMNFQLLSAEKYAMEQRFAVGNLHHHALSGMIKDMSTGGMKVQLDELPPQGINKGDIFLFHLPHASLRRDIAATVLDVITGEGGFNLHFEFCDVDMLTRMKLNQYLHRRKTGAQAA